MGLELFSDLLGAVVGSALTNNVQKMNDLDSKSGWRNKLFNLASKDMMTLDGVYLLRATLRFNKHQRSAEMYSFSWMTDLIITYCDELVEKYDCDRGKEGQPIFLDGGVDSKNDREVIRILSRYLLKYHWETFSSRKFFLSNNLKFDGEIKVGKEAYELVASLDNGMVDKATNSLNAISTEGEEKKMNGRQKGVFCFTTELALLTGLLIIYSLYLIQSGKVSGAIAQWWTSYNSLLLLAMIFIFSGALILAIKTYGHRRDKTYNKHGHIQSPKKNDRKESNDASNDSASSGRNCCDNQTKRDEEGSNTVSKRTEIHSKTTHSEKTEETHSSYERIEE